MRRRFEKVWDLPKVVPDLVKHSLAAYSPIEQQLLFNRGIKDLESAEIFLNAQDDFHRLYLLKGLREAVKRIHWAILDNQKIIVFGDYDVDGVTATALLVQVLTKLGGKADHYIPDRFDEGYGFSENAIQGVLALKPDLIITVDCGVRSIREVDLINAKGVDVIITDHHQPLEDLPHACAIINPKQPGDAYPFKELAGVGLAYKLALAVANQFHEKDLNIDNWLDLVALGTVADVAPLQDENRVLVSKGLKVINKENRPGITALIKVSGLVPGKIKAHNIGFGLGPRLNAAGRLSTAENAYQLLMAESMETAIPLAISLNLENQDRQAITREIQAAIEDDLESQEDGETEPLIFQYRKDYNEGVVGLAASRLAERYYLPSIVGTINEDETIKASCRSIPEINITEALDMCKDLLLTHGGHAMAAGFKIEARNAEEFRQKITAVIIEKIGGKALQPKIKAGAVIDFRDLHPDLISFINRLEPTGAGNPYPLFISHDVIIGKVFPMGRENAHLRLQFTKEPDKKGNDFKDNSFPAIAFGFGYLAEKLKAGDRVDILYAFEINEFRGDSTLQMNIKDIQIKLKNE